jgi:hypothetical protein
MASGYIKASVYSSGAVLDVLEFAAESFVFIICKRSATMKSVSKFASSSSGGAAAAWLQLQLCMCSSQQLVAETSGPVVVMKHING